MGSAEILKDVLCSDTERCAGQRYEKICSAAILKDVQGRDAERCAGTDTEICAVQRCCAAILNDVPVAQATFYIKKTAWSQNSVGMRKKDF